MKPRRLGVHENTIRNWKQRGLLRAMRLPGSGYRRFGAEQVDQLRAEMLTQLAPAETGLVAKPRRPMKPRVGVYIDGFNLYYGGRDLCGRGRAGWRWLDVRGLAGAILGRRRDWQDSSVERIVYCTARIDAKTNPVGQQEQDVYLKALRAANAVDLIEYGHYVARVKRAPLATPDRRGRPILTPAEWPVKIQDGTGAPIRDARFMVSYAYREEKGSDVNVASHLLLDTLQGAIDAAIVVSNDSDLRFPIEQVRGRVPGWTDQPVADGAGWCTSRRPVRRRWATLVGSADRKRLPQQSNA